MSSPEEVAAQAEALARVRAARVERNKARKPADEAYDRLKEEIRAARAKGAAVKDLMRAAELSRQRINQILGS